MSNLQIRTGMFETNSSSMHTIVFSNKKPKATLEAEIEGLQKSLDSDGFLPFNQNCNDFGRGFELIQSLKTKIEYVLASINPSDAEILVSILKRRIPGLKGINLAVYIDCASFKEAISDIGQKYTSYKDWNINEAYGYVDHQSQDNISNCISAMRKMENYKDMTYEQLLEEIMFNNEIVIVLDSDEQYFFEEMIRSGSIESENIKYVLKTTYHYDEKQNESNFITIKEYIEKLDEDDE